MCYEVDSDTISWVGCLPSNGTTSSEFSSTNTTSSRTLYYTTCGDSINARMINPESFTKAKLKIRINESSYCSGRMSNNNNNNNNGLHMSFGVTGLIKSLRNASIRGYTIGRRPPSHTASLDAVTVIRHDLYYDIETSYDRMCDSLIGSEIIMITCLCSCGAMKTFGRHAVNRNGVVSKDFSSSYAISKGFMKYVMEHRPTFLIAHNAYGFDNRVLAHHLAKDLTYHTYFRNVSTKNETYAGFKLIIAIPGVNNVDSLAYIKTSKFSSYKSFSLAGLSQQLGTYAKKSAPRFDLDLSAKDYEKMFDYNLADCYALKGVCDKLQILTEITDLCSSAMCPFEDTCVYKTGVMSWSYILYECLSQGKYFEWPLERNSFSEIRGGQIIQTGIRLVSYNICLDFDSLYPSVINICNISPEVVQVRGDWKEDSPNYTDRLLGDFSLDWTERSCTFSVNGISATFPSLKEGRSIMSKCCDSLVKSRYDCNSKGQTSLASCKKILNNSTYGALACNSYPSYSPICASCITAGSRHALEILSLSALIVTGKSAFYGDTDSIFVRCEINGSIEGEGGVLPEIRLSGNIRAVMTCILSFTPLDGLKIKLEKHPKSNRHLFCSMVCLEPKIYAQMSLENEITVKGLSLVRRGGCAFTNSVQLKIVTAMLKFFKGENVYVENTLASRVQERAIASIYLQYKLAIVSGSARLVDLATTSTIKGVTSSYLMLVGENGKDFREPFNKEDSTLSRETIASWKRPVSRKYYLEKLISKITSITKAIGIIKGHDIFRDDSRR